ncbi:MAG: hypothetical protein LC663_01150 [Actinobacteria bacterium]|nr:hypothetical protein [Actinomycetota bacterium]
MKKRLALLAVASIMMPLGVAATSHAESQCTDYACIDVNEGNNVVAADGNDNNQYPTGGYILITKDGQVCASDAAGPHTANWQLDPDSDCYIG